MTRLLIRSTGDWGDEFDLQGFAIMNKEDWENIKEGIPDKEFEAYYGSNEFVTFDGKDDYLSHMEEIEILEEDEETMVRLLKLYRPFPNKIVLYGLFVIKSDNY